MITLRGAVVGCDPTAAGPKGLAKWIKESVSAIGISMRRFVGRSVEMSSAQFLIKTEDKTLDHLLSWRPLFCVRNI